MIVLINFHLPVTVLNKLLSQYHYTVFMVNIWGNSPVKPSQMGLVTWPAGATLSFSKHTFYFRPAREITLKVFD